MGEFLQSLGRGIGYGQSPESCALTTGHKNCIPGRIKRHSAHRSAVFERGTEWLSRVRIPDSHAWLQTGGRQLTAIGAETHYPAVVRMTKCLRRRRAIRHRPKARFAVISARGDEMVVGAEARDSDSVLPCGESDHSLSRRFPYRPG